MFSVPFPWKCTCPSSIKRMPMLLFGHLLRQNQVPVGEEESLQLLHPHHTRGNWNGKKLPGKRNNFVNVNFSMPQQRNCSYKSQYHQISSVGKQKSSAKEVQKGGKKAHQQEEGWRLCCGIAYFPTNCFFTQRVVKVWIQCSVCKECSRYEQADIFINDFCDMITDKVTLKIVRKLLKERLLTLKTVYML